MIPTNFKGGNIKIYTQAKIANRWLDKYWGCRPIFICTLGFTKTALIEGISTAGATPASRRFTALADAEFLVNGVQQKSKFALPPLHVGVSPVFISRAVVEKFDLPISVFNAGLLEPPSVSHIDLQGKFAQCVSTGNALPLKIVQNLFHKGLYWGEKLALSINSSYLLLSECVVGGTTTALAILTALGIDASGKVNSSHPLCNHGQKYSIVMKGLARGEQINNLSSNPLEIIAMVGDPMQIFVAGVAIAASRKVGVMLAGGTQMLAVFALMKALNQKYKLSAQWSNVIVGTTRWVAEDETADAIGLANLIGDISVCATSLNFSDSQYDSLRKYEHGFVKEGVGAGGSAIAAHLLGIKNQELLTLVEAVVSDFHMITNS